MNIVNIIENESRKFARELFPNSSRGRSLCRMTADCLGTDVETVHKVGLIIIMGTILVKFRK